MTTRTRFLPSLRAGILAALLLTFLAHSSAVRPPRGRTSVASGGAIGRSFESTVPGDAARAAVRRRLERARDTYIGEMLVERDSSLARWPDRDGRPLLVWVQPVSRLDGWTDGYVDDVRRAFRQWDALQLPVGFAFTPDSVLADVHVTFVDHFDEEISGRTKWARDDEWWITEADITLAVHHRDGAILDDDAMHAMSLHEVGHLLGLDHTEDSTSIMAPRVRVRSLSHADRATVRLLYALPPGGVR